MPNIYKAIKFMVDTANDNTHGYNIEQRFGNPDYDCSSLVCRALYEGGFDLVWQNYWTENMYDMLIKNGFRTISAATPLQAGDILLNVKHHTAMMISDTQLAEAVHNEHYGDPAYYEDGGWFKGGEQGDQTGDEIRIRDFYIYSPSKGGWNYILRYMGGLEWKTSDDYLTVEEAENNAWKVYIYLSSLGYTVNAIAGICGNMFAESTLNPTLWEKGKTPFTPTAGYGLVQWTPYTNYADVYPTNWQTKHDNQLEWLDKYTDKGQWIPTTSYPESWVDFKNSTATPEYLAKSFFYNFERGTWLESRSVMARIYYDLFSTTPPPTPPPVPPPTPTTSKEGGLKPWFIYAIVK